MFEIVFLLFDLDCHSFLNVHVKETSYGRSTINGKKLCNGQKPDDSFAPSEDCFDAIVEKNITKELRDECAGQYECTWTVPTFYLGFLDRIHPSFGPTNTQIGQGIEY